MSVWRGINQATLAASPPLPTPRPAVRAACKHLVCHFHFLRKNLHHFLQMWSLSVISRDTVHGATLLRAVGAEGPGAEAAP